MSAVLAPAFLSTPSDGEDRLSALRSRQREADPWLTLPLGGNDHARVDIVGDALTVVAAVLEDELLHGVLIHERLALVEVLEVVDVCARGRVSAELGEVTRESTNRT